MLFHTGWPSKRNILWLMVFLGTGYNYMARLNINIAIVSMVKTQDSEMGRVSSSECFEPRTHTNYTNEIKTSGERFEWDEYKQGMILGAYYWTYWAGQLPAALLSQKFGTKIIFGLSNLGICLCGLFIPFAARLDFRLLIALRTIQGFVGELFWPSLNTMIGLWIPPNERSRFLTSYMGSSVGAMIIYPVCGLLIEWFDWPVVFYATAIFGVFWIIPWWLWIYDSPDEHPTISEEELLHIKKSLGDTVTKKKPPMPWKAILTSLPMWINILSQWGNIWGLFLWITQAPTFFQFIHGLDIRMTGMLSAIPHAGRLIAAYAISAGCDYLLRHNKMSHTNVRKLAIAICCLVQGSLAFCLAFTGCNYIAVIVLLTLATACTGAEAAGALGNLVDLSPNYASIMHGISQSIAVIPGMISPMVVSYFTFQNQTVEQWQNVFFISTAVIAIPGFFSLCFTSSELQEWNSPKIVESEELDKLNSSAQNEEKEYNDKNLPNI